MKTMSISEVQIVLVILAVQQRFRARDVLKNVSIS
jgi:hypothetical protein